MQIMGREAKADSIGFANSLAVGAAAPLYYFNIFDCTDDPDQDGFLLRDDDHARSEAIQTACEMASTAFNPALSEWRMEAVDEARRSVCRISIATAFAQDDSEAAKMQWRKVADQLRPKLRKLAALMDDAEADVLAYMTFPAAHRTKLRSTNPIERVNGEIKRRTEVVGIFPN